MFYKYDDSIYSFFYKQKELKTIQDYNELHRIYWGLISDRELLQKPIIRSYDSNDIIQNNCFACAYAVKVARTLGVIERCCICRYCPIQQYRKAVSVLEVCPCCDGGPYLEWQRTNIPEFAKQISELKFTEPNT